MLGFLERQRLVKKGLACSKLRRRRTESELAQTLESGVIAKGAIFIAFMAGLCGLIYSDSVDQPWEKGFIAALIFLTALAQLWINHPQSFASNSCVALIFSVFLLHLAAVKLERFLDPTGVFLERRDPDGGVVWHVDFEGNGLPDLTVAPDGVIAALIRGPTRRIVRLDPATGQELSSVNVPGVERLGGANAQGAVGLGPIGSSSIGVARFTPAP